MIKRVKRDGQIELFKNLARLNQEQLIKVMYNFLLKSYNKVKLIPNGGILATGNIPICLVAHADTVFPSPPREIFYDLNHDVLWSPDGLGADDRAGIFAIAKIISLGYLPHIVITQNEEMSCMGAQEILQMKNVDRPFRKLKYIIELDRRGSNEAVFYDCPNQKFKEYITSFGLEEAKGSYSDIAILCPEWNRAGVNLSVGYYDEHQYSEFFKMHELNRIIRIVIDMLKEFNTIETFTYFGL